MINKENLIKLRDGLLKHYEVVNKRFDIALYRSSEPKVNSERALGPEHACGTQGCVVGWMPFLGIEEFIPCEFELTDNSEIQCYLEYSERLLFTDTDKVVSLLWEFMFSAEWDYMDYKTLDHALERINLVIDHGIDVFRQDNEQVDCFVQWNSVSEDLTLN